MVYVWVCVFWLRSQADGSVHSLSAAAQASPHQDSQTAVSSVRRLLHWLYINIHCDSHIPLHSYLPGTFTYPLTQCESRVTVSTDYTTTTFAPTRIWRCRLTFMSKWRLMHVSEVTWYLKMMSLIIFYFKCLYKIHTTLTFYDLMLLLWWKHEHRVPADGQKQKAAQ